MLAKSAVDLGRHRRAESATFLVSRKLSNLDARALERRRTHRGLRLGTRTVSDRTTSELSKIVWTEVWSVQQGGRHLPGSTSYSLADTEILMRSKNERGLLRSWNASSMPAGSERMGRFRQKDPRVVHEPKLRHPNNQTLEASLVDRRDRQIPRYPWGSLTNSLGVETSYLVRVECVIPSGRVRRRSAQCRGASPDVARCWQPRQ